jgi:hypothetical protein
MNACDKEFLDFLRLAKQATYAAESNAARVTPLLPDSRQLEYASGEFLYRDVYFGMFRFVGQEVVCRANKAIWSMAYSGGLTHGIAKGEASTVYRALRAALTATPLELPVRGPAEFQFEDLRYICAIHGAMPQFRGTESIVSLSGSVLYGLEFSGGQLS